MPRQALLAIVFASFFTALVPLALACEVAARGHAGCGTMACETSRGIEHCAGDRATAAPTLSKLDSSDAPHPPVAVLIRASATDFGSLWVRFEPHAPHPGLQSLSPLTLQSLAVLLRI